MNLALDDHLVGFRVKCTVTLGRHTWSRNYRCEYWYVQYVAPGLSLIFTRTKYSIHTRMTTAHSTIPSSLKITSAYCPTLVVINTNELACTHSKNCMSDFISSMHLIIAVERPPKRVLLVR
jgi:hypothetical protein